MKTKVLIFGLVLSVVLFIDFLLLTIIGCSAGACEAGAGFYCTVFCKFATILIIATTILPIFIAAYKTFKANTI